MRRGTQLRCGPVNIESGVEPKDVCGTDGNNNQQNPEHERVSFHESSMQRRDAKIISIRASDRRSDGILIHMPFPGDLPPPLLTLAAELGLSPADVEESFVRGSGKGGQKMNKTSSTVQLKHLPTGLEVRVQQHREQSRNRLSAWKLLIFKLEERIKGKQSQRMQAVFKLRKQKQRRSRKAKNKMLDAKHHRSGIKENRRRVD